MDQAQATAAARAQEVDAPSLYRLTAEQFEAMAHAGLFAGSEDGIESREDIAE